MVPPPNNETVGHFSLRNMFCCVWICKKGFQRNLYVFSIFNLQKNVIQIVVYETSLKKALCEKTAIVSVIRCILSEGHNIKTCNICNLLVLRCSLRIFLAHLY